MKVSVVLPVYNVAPYLEEAFESLCHQTLRNIEIIVVNDGSTDNSLEIIEKYTKKDERIRCYSQENKGLSGARNTGMQHCTGEYVYFMDSDDVIETDTLECCYKTAKEQQADICIFDADIFYEKNANPLSWNYDRSDVLEEDKAYEGAKLFDLLLDRRKHNAVVWLQFINWNFLKSLQLNFRQGIIHEDELFTPQIFLQAKSIFYINRRFVKHRVRSSSIIGKSYSQRNINCYLTVMDELFKFQDSPLIRKYARYTLSKVFYTGHLIPLKEKPAVFWRALKSGYLKYIGWKSSLVFWLKH
jgi:glycosyltransferase involved in cell wall biosynthesis